MSGRARRAPGEKGQMTVELAVLVPPAIVTALIVFNLMGFIDACAAFDRLSLAAVTAHGVAPAGVQTGPAAAEEVRSAIADALGREGSCEVRVSAQAAGQDSADGASCGSLVISPLLTRYTCTLLYRPWPRFLRMPGITLEAPLALRHERSLVVDRYRPGVVI